MLASKHRLEVKAMAAAASTAGKSLGRSETPGQIALRRDVYIVISAFNEVDTIRDIVQRTLQCSEHVILVDDGSQDGTAEAVKDLPITLIRKDRNGGKASALLLGFGRALEEGAAAVITLDADGQHFPEEIPLFLQAFQKHPDHVIVGSRLWNRAAVPGIRYWANRFATFWVSWASGVNLQDAQSGFRLYPGALLKSVSAGHGTQQGFTFESEFLINAARAGCGISFVNIRVVYPNNHMQQTHYHHVRDNARMVRMIVGKLLSRRQQKADQL
jgi:glycosyltransferase involved in cell wall biosynthesis